MGCGSSVAANASSPPSCDSLSHPPSEQSATPTEQSTTNILIVDTTPTATTVPTDLTHGGVVLKPLQTPMTQQPSSARPRLPATHWRSVLNHQEQYRQSPKNGDCKASNADSGSYGLSSSKHQNDTNNGALQNVVLDNIHHHSKLPLSPPEVQLMRGGLGGPLRAAALELPRTTTIVPSELKSSSWAGKTSWVTSGLPTPRRSVVRFCIPNSYTQDDDDDDDLASELISMPELLGWGL